MIPDLFEGVSQPRFTLTLTSARFGNRRIASQKLSKNFLIAIYKIAVMIIMLLAIMMMVPDLY